MTRTRTHDKNYEKIRYSQLVTYGPSQPFGHLVTIPAMPALPARPGPGLTDRLRERLPGAAEAGNEGDRMLQSVTLNVATLQHTVTPLKHQKCNSSRKNGP